MAVAASAATRPHYGGTLRVQIRTRVTEPGADDQLAWLLCDRLVRLDARGEPQPALAVSWQQEAGRWKFRLRSGVKFHDGSPLTAAAAASALESLGATAQGESIMIRSDRPLALELARPRYSVWRRAAEGVVVGTGPFRLTEFEPGQRAVFAANDEYWEGRPYLDSVQVEMGRAQALDLELGKADVIEADLSRPLRFPVRSGPPADLLAIASSTLDPRLREAIAHTIDRAAIHGVLLRKQGAIAGGLLPQWLTGYAHLFPPARDVARARQRVAELHGPPPVTLAYDAADAVARAVAERVAVNAREAGVLVRTVPGGGAADARLVRARITSLDPGLALAELMAAAGQPLNAAPAASPEACYLLERSLLQDFRIIPLVHLPEAVGLGPRVRNWTGWDLAGVWLSTP
ncbi:MAG: hypothetical protein HYR60_03000 [Acidobacteria bacterium]|nr:hypothetical protein [Acidobacteriota bacterium]